MRQAAPTHEPPHTPYCAWVCLHSARAWCCQDAGESLLGAESRVDDTGWWNSLDERVQLLLRGGHLQLQTGSIRVWKRCGVRVAARSKIFIIWFFFGRSLDDVATQCLGKQLLSLRWKMHRESTYLYRRPSQSLQVWSLVRPGSRAKSNQETSLRLCANGFACVMVRNSWSRENGTETLPKAKNPKTRNLSPTTPDTCLFMYNIWPGLVILIMFPLSW